MTEVQNSQYASTAMSSDRAFAHPNRRNLPSETVSPTQVDEAPQQASTQPGDGTEVPVQGSKPGFKEQVIGYAQVRLFSTMCRFLYLRPSSQKTRGATLGKQELKEHGEAVLQGQADAREPAPKH